MGALYDAKQKLEKAIAEKKLVAAEVRGAVSLRAGLLLTFIDENTPDDDAKLARLRAAALAVLKTEL